MDVEKKIADLFMIVLQEMKTNPNFSNKLEMVFKDEMPAPKTTRKWKRNPASFNPETILEERGEQNLLKSLENLDVDQLKDIVSEFGMDPSKKVMRWRTKDKIVNHIIEMTKHRMLKGNAFRM